MTKAHGKVSKSDSFAVLLEGIRIVSTHYTILKLREIMVSGK